MKIAFAGFRHSHIFGLYNSVLEDDAVILKGCFEADEDAKKAAIESHNIDFNYNTYEDVLNDNEVEAIAIGDYYGKRGQMVIAALKAKKHVICDKPICTDLAELDEIEKLVDQKGLQVCCMLDLRYMSQIPKVCEIIGSGALGKIVNVTFTGQHCLDYGNRPQWYFEEGKHGGTLNDIAIHGIDVIRYITGKNLTKIDCARTWNAFADKEPAFEDCGQFMVRMDDVSIMADVSYAAPKFNGIMPTYWDFHFWGTEGMLTFNLCTDDIHIFKTEEEVIACEAAKPGYLKHFVQETQGIKTMMNTKDILASQRQVLQIQKAADENR